MATTEQKFLDYPGLEYYHQQNIATMDEKDVSVLDNSKSYTDSYVQAKGNELGTRIDNLILNAGDSSAECADARVTKDGTVHDTLKNRLDTEYSQLSSEIGNTYENILQANIFSEELANYSWEDGSYFDFYDGLKYTYKTMSCTNYVLLNPNSKYVFKGVSYLQICKYDINKNFIEGIKRDESSEVAITITTDEAIFIILSIHTVDKNNVIVSIENNDIKLLKAVAELNSKWICDLKTDTSTLSFVTYSFDSESGYYNIDGTTPPRISSYYNFLLLTNSLGDFEIGKDYFIKITNPNENVDIEVYYTEQEVADGFVRIASSTESFRFKIPDNQNIKGLLIRFYVGAGKTVDNAKIKVDICTAYPNEYMYQLEDKNEISILFIGNSLTQDGISYLPYVLRKYYPDIKFRFYMWYCGGKALSDHYSYFTNNKNGDTFSVAENTGSWINYDNSMTMESVLSEYQFDIVCMQEYFNYKDSYTDLTDWNNCRDYIVSHYKKNALEFVSLFHAPKRDNAEAIFNLTKEGNALILKESISQDIIPIGFSVYRALSTDLDALGDLGHLSPDGTHTQEGLPCLLQTYTALLWLFDRLNINKSIYGCNLRMTNDVYNSIKVPGANLGRGVVVGTDAENLLAQQIAIQSFKEGKKFLIDNLAN